MNILKEVDLEKWLISIPVGVLVVVTVVICVMAWKAKPVREFQMNGHTFITQYNRALLHAPWCPCMNK